MKNINKNLKKISVIFIIVLVFIIGISLVRLSFSFQLKKGGHLYVDYDHEYKDPGVSLRFFNQDLSDEVKITGKVDTKKLGKYEVKYSYKLGFIPIEKTREVEVIDQEIPVITMNGKDKMQICPKEKYEEEGFSAVDNYDGDITKEVGVIETDASIKYKVTDSSGNTAVVEREVIRKDEDAPVIRLSSGNTVYLKQGTSYKEFGYTAVDGCDGDLTSKVKVEGSVNKDVLGTYSLVYKVEDSSGNVGEVVRKVVVNQSSSSTSTGQPGVIYLTFDDGPSSSGSTAKILDVLKKEGVKATFFVTRSGSDALIKREFDEGHTVALHTYTHDYKDIYSSVDDYFADLEKIQARVKNITGETSTIIRFPGGSNNTVGNKYSDGIMKILREEVENRGFVYFDWNVDASDAGECARSKVEDKKTCVYNNVTRNLSKKRSNIVLMHDIKSYTADAVEDIISYGKKNGYIFEVLTSDVAAVHFK